MITLLILVNATSFDPDGRISAAGSVTTVNPKGPLSDQEDSTPEYPDDCITAPRCATSVEPDGRLSVALLRLLVRPQLFQMVVWLLQYA